VENSCLANLSGIRLAVQNKTKLIKKLQKLFVKLSFLIRKQQEQGFRNTKS